MMRSHEAREPSLSQNPTSLFDPSEDGAAAEDGSSSDLEHRVRSLEALVRVREAERDELAAALREAREAEQDAVAALRAGEEILAVVAHDLRNPLGTIVMGATALIGPGAPDPQRMAMVAERIQRQGERMAQQVANLGDYAAIQSGRLTITREPHRPHAIVAQAAALVGLLARERSVSFEARAAADLPAISCDAERVVQAIANLVGNALKVTPRGGAIEVGARSEPGQVMFMVRDTGPGLDAEELATMFGPRWHSRHSCYRGTGLGFSTARGIVAAHGGRIWADSAPGCGTTVSFSLPSVAR